MCGSVIYSFVALLASYDQHLYKLLDKRIIVAMATLEVIRQKNYILRRIATNQNHLFNGYASKLLNAIISIIKEKNGKIFIQVQITPISKCSIFFKSTVLKRFQSILKLKESIWVLSISI